MHTRFDILNLTFTPHKYSCKSNLHPEIIVHRGIQLAVRITPPKVEDALNSLLIDTMIFRKFGIDIQA